MEGIYLVHVREFISTNKNIYKIGRSHDIDNRVRQYPKGSSIILMNNCINSVLCEKELIKLFKTSFTITKFGTEYFEGDVDDMKDTINNYLRDMKIEQKKTASINKINENKVIETKVNNIVNDIDNNKIKNKKNKMIEPVDEKAIIICPTCTREFQYKSYLKAHFKKSFHCSKNDEEIKTFFNKDIYSNKCTKCNKNYKTTRALKRHLIETKCGKSQLHLQVNEKDEKDEKDEEKDLTVLRDRFISEYKKDNEKDPTENEIIDYLDNYEKDEEDNKEDEEDYDETSITDDTLDVGGNYGEKPQGGEGGEYEDF